MILDVNERDWCLKNAEKLESDEPPQPIKANAFRHVAAEIDRLNDALLEANNAHLRAREALASEQLRAERLSLHNDKLRKELNTFSRDRREYSADDIRDAGWSVAVHNDYRLDGLRCTFWLVTKNGHCVKGEGRTDAEALNDIRSQIYRRDNPSDQGIQDGTNRTTGGAIGQP